MNDLFYINNSIIITKLRSMGFNFRYGEDYKTTVSSRSSKDEVRISFRFSYEPQNGREEEPQPLEYFDLLVLDTIYYLWSNRMQQPTFSINDLIYAATGKVAYLQKNRIEKFRRSLEKLSSVFLEINCFYELEMREKTSDFESVLIGRLAPIRISTKSIQRNLSKDGAAETQEYDKTVYEITEEPILYRYTDINNQIIAIPHDMMLSKGAGVKNTDRALLVKYYLIRELELIRKSSERKQFRTKSFDDRFVRFISKTDNSNCLMQQVDSSDADGREDRIMRRRSLISCLTKSSFINETKNVKNIVERYLDFFVRMGYLSPNSQKPKKITRNTVINYICSEFSERFTSGSAEKALVIDIMNSIKEDEDLSEEQLPTAENLIGRSISAPKKPYSFIYRSGDERGAVIGVEVEKLNDPNSIEWCANIIGSGDQGSAAAKKPKAESPVEDPIETLIHNLDDLKDEEGRLPFLDF